MSLLPLFPLDLVLLPESPLPLHIFEPRYKEMVGECLRRKEPFGVIRIATDGIVRVGCTAEIVDVLRTYPDGRMDILALGRRRFAVQDVDRELEFLRGEVEYLEEETESTIEQSTISSVFFLHRTLMDLLGRGEEPIEEDGPMLSYRLTSALPVDLDFKQQLLEMRAETTRLESLIVFYRKAIPKLKSHQFSQKKSNTNGWIH